MLLFSEIDTLKLFSENVTHERESDIEYERNQAVLCYAAGRRQENDRRRSLPTSGPLAAASAPFTPSRPYQV